MLDYFRAEKGAGWKRPINLLITVLLLGVVVSWCITWRLKPPTDWFNALNTLFTGLGFVGVTAAFWHERQDAKERDREHRQLLTAMADQTKASVRAAKIQALVSEMKMLEDELICVQSAIDEGKVIFRGLSNPNLSGIRDNLMRRQRSMGQELQSLTGLNLDY